MKRKTDPLVELEIEARSQRERFLSLFHGKILPSSRISNLSAPSQSIVQVGSLHPLLAVSSATVIGFLCDRLLIGVGNRFSFAPIRTEVIRTAHVAFENTVRKIVSTMILGMVSGALGGVLARKRSGHDISDETLSHESFTV